MDINQLYGLLSITNVPIICSIPTTYFTQGVDGFSECIKNNYENIVEDDDDDDDDDDNGDNDDENNKRNRYDDDDINQNSDNDSNNNNNNNNNYNEQLDLDLDDEDKNSKKRVRYLREEYNCSSCKYTCTTEKAYVKHSIKCNGNDVDIKLSCVVCGKDMKNVKLLDNHMKNHKSGKQFSCDLCKYKSLQLKKLIQHRRMHTGEKPHLCPYCDYRSSRRDNLKSHVKRVHKKILSGDTFVPRSIVIKPRDNDFDNNNCNGLN